MVLHTVLYEMSEIKVFSYVLYNFLFKKISLKSISINYKIKIITRKVFNLIVLLFIFTLHFYNILSIENFS